MTNYDTHALVTELGERARAMETLAERIEEARGTLNVLILEIDKLRHDQREKDEEINRLRAIITSLRNRVRRMEEGDL